MLVILGFLLSVRATLVTAVSIPLSVLLAMAVLQLGGQTLNILTLGALTIAVGRVVDDSIVVIENITRHLARGEPRRRAIVGAVREVAGAITASTVTTVAVFAPIGLVGGQVGELFRPFAITVTAALLASLLVSLTVVPVLASVLLKRPDGEPVEEEEQAPSRLQRGYLPVLRAAIGRPLISLGLAVAILAGTFALVPLLQTNFLGDAGGDTLSVSQELPAGTGLPQTDEAAKQVEAVLADVDGVDTYQVTVGAAEGRLTRPGSSDTATRFTVTLAADADATAVTDDLRERLGELTGAGTVSVEAGQGGFGSDRLAVDVRATDPAVLAEAAGQVEAAVADIPDATDVRNDLAAAQPVVDVTVDRQKAAAAGVTEAQVGQVVAAALRGSPAGSLTIDGVAQDVLLRAGDVPADLTALKDLPVGGATLGEIASVTETSTAPTITRTDGERSAQVSARPAAEDIGAVTTALQAALGDLDLPEGATAEIAGVSAEQSEAFGQLGIALLTAIAVVYLVMVMTFRSLLQPLLLLVSIPFAATGALGLLLLTGTPLGVPALIGMLMLVGIVVTNAIVLIDLVNQYRRAGRSVRDAVLDGAAQRLRPILMTAVATICALLPMAFGITGGGGFISQPLAIVVIGGLVSSTILTLVLVPVLYVLVERVRGRDVAASAGVEVRGRVADRDGAPLAGTAVAVFDNTAAQIATTVSGPAGEFAAAVPAAGEHLVVAQHGDRAPTAEWTRDGVALDLRVDGPAAVEGQVRQLAGGGVAAVVTVADAAGAVLGGTVAGADGRFRVPDLPAGEHRVLVAPPGGPATVRTVDVPTTGTVRCDVTLPPAGGLAGTVRSGPSGVAGAVATVADADGRVVATVRTEADGSFRLSGLPDGAYTLTASAGVPVVAAVQVREGTVTSTDLELGANGASPDR